VPSVSGLLGNGPGRLLPIAAFMALGAAAGTRSSAAVAAVVAGNLAWCAASLWLIPHPRHRVQRPEARARGLVSGGRLLRRREGG
jgi:hypothetical protein